MYLVKTPSIVQNIFNKLIWQIDTPYHIYLTFDDGPDPQCTPWVLQTLKQYNAKASFFCIGQNAERYPELVQQIKSEGHALGNHSYSHHSGWSTNTSDYVADALRCDTTINSKLFRPPFGRLKPSQIKKISKYYKIVMWDVMSGDFDEKLHPDLCLANVTEIANAGSIVLFHDTQQCLDKLKYVLPKALDFFDNEGLICASLPS